TLTWICLLCGTLMAGCAAEKRPSDGADIDDELDASIDLDGGDSEQVAVGDPIDVNGDGTNDGEAVDTNGDGIPDGVDTDGDGDVDAPLPGNTIPVARVAAAPMPTSDAGVLIPSDAAPTPFPTNDAVQVMCGSG